MTKNLKGTYCLLIALKKDSKIMVGKIGRINFKSGYYVYTGSALNSLVSRLKRHLSSEKKVFWHIDYLLDSVDAEIVEIVFAVDSGKWECLLADQISENADLSVPKFGCSDCRCLSHLFFFNDIDESKDTCLNGFKKLDLKPKLLDDLKNM